MSSSRKSTGGSKEQSLQQIAGIGPRNEQRFISAGIDTVPRLAGIFFESNKGDEDRMRVYLQKEVGIRNRQHCAKIVSHLAGMEWQGAQSCGRSRQKVTLCVEGNISAGKSTFLQKLLKGSVELRNIIEDLPGPEHYGRDYDLDLVAWWLNISDRRWLDEVCRRMKPGMACQVVPEPVDKWQNIQASNGGEPANLLEAFYKEPSRFAYTFQNYVFVTRLMQAKDSEDCTAPLRLLERSVFSDRMVFVRAVHEAKWLSEMELSIYDSWFDPVVSSLKGLVPDGFIYLAASPETCMRRMTARGRGEEGGVSLEYLDNLHTKHEEWLHTGTLRREDMELLSDPSRNRNMPLPNSFVSNLGVSLGPPPEEPESLRGKVFYLNQDKEPLLQKHIDGLPALYLDCDEDIDMERDQAAKDTFAKQIKDFSDHVRKVREARYNASLIRPRGMPPGLMALPDRKPELLNVQSMRDDHKVVQNFIEQSRQHACL